MIDFINNLLNNELSFTVLDSAGEKLADQQENKRVSTVKYLNSDFGCFCGDRRTYPTE